MKIIATIEARMTSKRLPGKVLLPVLGEPILSYLIQRLRKVKSIENIVLATTINRDDDILVDYAKSMNIEYFRGDEEDVMSRVIGAGESVQADIIVEITGDCPIIDPDIVELTIQSFLANKCDYASNAHIRSYPDGMDVQVYSLDTLKKSSILTNNPLDREHVTLHIRNNPEIFRHFHVVAQLDCYWPELGLTLDTNEDYALLKKIIEALYPINPFFNCSSVIQYLKQNSFLLNLNREVIRKGDS